MSRKHEGEKRSILHREHLMIFHNKELHRGDACCGAAGSANLRLRPQQI